MPSMTTTKKRTPRSFVFNTISPESYPSVTLAASQSSATIQAGCRTILPVACKVVGIVSYASAVGATLPLGNLFNIAVGEGAYQTGTTGVAASASLTVATPHTGDIITINFGGASFQYQVKSTDTTATILANSICQAWQQFNVAQVFAQANTIGAAYLQNAIYLPAVAAFVPYTGLPLNKVLGVWNNAGAGVLVFSTLFCGTALNGQTLTAAVTGTGATTTITASANLASGANSTGISVATNDTLMNNGLYVVGTLGQALFANDAVLSGPAPGYYGTFYEPTNWDAIYQQGTNLTLRATSGVGASATNWSVDLLIDPYDIAPNKEMVPVGSAPGSSFSPGRVLF